MSQDSVFRPTQDTGDATFSCRTPTPQESFSDSSIDKCPLDFLGSILQATPSVHLWEDSVSADTTQREEQTLPTVDRFPAGLNETVNLRGIGPIFTVKGQLHEASQCQTRSTS